MMARWLLGSLLLVLLHAAPAVGVQFSDDFARPDSQDVGPAWTPQRVGGDAQLVNERVRGTALTNGNEESNSIVLSGNQFARITITTFVGPGYGDAGVFLRAAAPPDRTFVACSAQKNDPSTTTITRRLQGAHALLASEAATAWANGDVLEFSVVGSTYVCKRNGVVVLTADDANLTSGRVGFRVREDADLSNTDIDSFIAGDMGQGILTATWIAPTTNTDTSALTDLATYRIYYLLTTTAAPCPGSQFFEMAAPMAAPPPNRTETYDMSGLIAGQPYRVMVTAVDSIGNESACSDFAEAIARSLNAPPGALTNTRVQ
jgi:hypothetical protein